MPSSPLQLYQWLAAGGLPFALALLTWLWIHGDIISGREAQAKDELLRGREERITALERDKDRLSDLVSRNQGSQQSQAAATKELAAAFAQALLELKKAGP